MADRPDLDHIALALERHRDALPRYAGQLGGTWVSGGFGLGFAPAQIRYANGMKVELLAPYAVDQNDFLRRFLDRHGPGPHHLTFKVPDIQAAIGRLEAAGFTPVGTDLRDPGWLETFIHPKQAFGIVVQIAEANSEWNNPPPKLFPEPSGPPAALVRVEHAVNDLRDALALFEDQLGGDRAGAGDGWVELAWPSGGHLRLIEDRAEAPGRTRTVVFAIDDVERVPDAEPTAEGSWHVAAEDNYGADLTIVGAAPPGR